MEVKPGYKHTEVGVIPEDWPVSPLENFMSFISYGFTNPMPTSESGVYMITAKDINHGRIQYESARCTTEEAYRSLLTAKSRPRHGDLLLTKDGTLGRLALVGHRTVCINQSVAILRPNSRAVPQFLKVLLEAPQYQNRMLEDAGGSTIRHIYITIVNRMPVGVPPTKGEQEAIAEVLSSVDDLIETVEQLLAKKRHIRRSALEEFLTGNARLPGSHARWPVKPLGELFEFNGGLSVPRDQLSEEGHCYLHYGDIHLAQRTFVDVQFEHNSIPKLDVSLKRIAKHLLLDDGDVVFVRASEDEEGISKHVVIVNKDQIPFIAGMGTLVAKAKTTDLDHTYRRFCFQTADVKRQFQFFAAGTKVSGISTANLARVTIPVPSFPEQAAIAAVLSDMDAEIEVLESRLGKTRRLKQGMMQQLLTGRIRLV